MVASRTQGKPKILETIAGTEYHETNNNALSNLKPTQKSTNVNGNSLETSESSPEKQRPNQTGAVSAETSLKEAQCTSKKSLRPDSDHFKSYLKAYREGRAKLNAENRQEGNAMARLAQHVELDPSARRKDHRSSPVRRASVSVSTTPTTKRNEVSTSAAFASSSPRPTLAASGRRAPARLEAWGGEGAAASGSARPGTPEEYFSSAQTRLHRSDDQADDSFRAARRPSAHPPAATAPTPSNPPATVHRGAAAPAIRGVEVTAEPRRRSGGGADWSFSDIARRSSSSSSADSVDLPPPFSAGSLSEPDAQAEAARIGQQLQAILDLRDGATAAATRSPAAPSLVRAEAPGPAPVGGGSRTARRSAHKTRWGAIRRRMEKESYLK